MKRYKNNYKIYLNQRDREILSEILLLRNEYWENFNKNTKYEIAVKGKLHIDEYSLSLYRGMQKSSNKIKK